MKIAGFVKSSFIDYPQHISCVVFTPGCNMNCWYCHNKHLNFKHEDISEEEVFAYLERNKGFIEGVAVSGGEPTLQKDLGEFLQKIKNLGFKVKLDTNGTNAEMVKSFIEKGIVDFVAMDIKAPFAKYKEVTFSDDNIESIKALRDLLLSNVVDYEFRTTFVGALSVDDIAEIAKSISGAKAYAIQKYRPNNKGEIVRDDSEQQEAACLAGKFVKTVISRGL